METWVHRDVYCLRKVLKALPSLKAPSMTLYLCHAEVEVVQVSLCASMAPTLVLQYA